MLSQHAEQIETGLKHNHAINKSSMVDMVMVKVMDKFYYWFSYFLMT